MNKNRGIGDYMEYTKVTDEDIKKFNEDNLMFITNPGRMGDLYGSTFVMKEDNELKEYYLDNIFRSTSIVDVFKEWKNTVSNDDNKSDKYIYVYMGFGNGLCVDKRIYAKYYPYLLKEVKKDDLYEEESGDNYNPCINYSVWEKALDNMIKDDK